MTSINTGTSMNDTSSLRSRTVNKTENGRSYAIYYSVSAV